MKKLFLLLALLLSTPCFAQQGAMIGPVPPCIAFGTAAATCAQGDDSRITGAAQQTARASWTPADASGAGLTLTANSVSWIKVGDMVYVSGFISYPVTADTSAAKIGWTGPPAVPNSTYGDAPFVIVSPSVVTNLIGLPIQNTSTFNIISAGNVAVQNVTLSNKSVFFLMIYPAT